MVILPRDPWEELSVWIQRRHMVNHCLRFDMGDSRGEVEAFIGLIDLCIRSRLRFLHDISVSQSIETIPMPKNEPKRRRRKEPSPP
jgi:hypothetical protein